MKQGFTYIEVMISLAIGAVCLSLVIFYPTSLLKTKKEIGPDTGYYESVNTLVIAISHDIKESYQISNIEDNTFILSGSKYSFQSDGVYRESKTHSAKLSDLVFDFSYKDSLLTITDKASQKPYSFYVEIQGGEL